MANDILGGGGSARLSQNLREDKGWAYGAYSYLPNARGQRPLVYYAPVQSDKTLESLQEILTEVGQYVDSAPPTDEELNRNRESALRSVPGRFETANSVRGYILDLVTYDRPMDYFETSLETLRNMEVAEISQIAEEQYRLRTLSG